MRVYNSCDIIATVKPEAGLGIGLNGLNDLANSSMPDLSLEIDIARLSIFT